MPKFLLAGDNSILRGKIERNRRFTIYLSKKKLDKACFQHDMEIMEIQRFA